MRIITRIRFPIKKYADGFQLVAFVEAILPDARPFIFELFLRTQSWRGSNLMHRSSRSDDKFVYHHALHKQGKAIWQIKIQKLIQKTMHSKF